MKNLILPLLIPFVLMATPKIEECHINNKVAPQWLCPGYEPLQGKSDYMYSVVKYEYSEESSMYKAYKELLNSFSNNLTAGIIDNITNVVSKEKTFSKKEQKNVIDTSYSNIYSNFIDYVELTDKWNDNINFYLYGKVNKEKLEKEIKLYTNKAINQRLKIKAIR